MDMFQNGSPPPLEIIPISKRQYTLTEQLVYTKEISSLLQMDAIQEIDPNDPCFVSNLFLVPKKSESLRPVIDLRRLNQFIKYSHFKMEGIELVKSLVRRGDYMV